MHAGFALPGLGLASLSPCEATLDGYVRHSRSFWQGRKLNPPRLFDRLPDLRGERQ